MEQSKYLLKYYKNNNPVIERLMLQKRMSIRITILIICSLTFFAMLIFSNASKFKGEISLKQYWMAVLCYNVFICAVYMLDVIISSLIGYPFFLLTTIVGLATFIPVIAVMVRRLHDIYKTGWSVFTGCIPVIGPVLLLFFFCEPGEAVPEKTKHGRVDYITWGVVAAIFILGLVFLLSEDMTMMGY